MYRFTTNVQQLTLTERILDVKQTRSNLPNAHQSSCSPLIVQALTPISFTISL